MRTPEDIKAEIECHRSIDRELERLLKNSNSVLSAVWLSIIGWWISIAYSFIASVI